MADDTIRSAWHRYGTFDAQAVTYQQTFLRVRRATLSIGVLTAAAGIASAGATAVLAADPTSAWTNVAPWLRWGTIVLSVCLTGLFGYALKFDRGADWVTCRRCAELILREIYLYRVRRGRYRNVANVDEVLARQIKTADVGIRLLRDTRRAETMLEPRQAAIPLADGQADDGVRAIEIKDYLGMRVEAQRKWYGGKVARLSAQLRMYQGLSIFVGLCGAVLASAGGVWTAWVALSTAIAAAMTSWTETRRLESTLGAYQQAATALDDMLLWWGALDDVARKNDEKIEELVTDCEAIIDGENSSWTQDMLKRVADLKAEAAARVADKNAH